MTAMNQPVLLLALILGFLGYARGCAMVRATSGDANINVTENDGMVEVCAKFTEPAAVAGVLNLFTVVQTSGAESPEDYLDISVNFTIPINQTDDLCANVTIETDNVLEDPELFLADLQSDTVEICDIRQAFVVISDSTRIPVEFELDEIVSVSEEGIMDVCVRIFPNEFEFDRAVTYNLVIVEEGATATISGVNIDFIFTPPVESINAPDDILQCGQVSIIPDTFVESDEFFDITLVSEDSIDLLNGPSRFIIADNDGASVILADSSATVTEGNSGTTSVQYCIVLDSDEELARDVVFLASTMDGSADSSDYEEFSDRELTIPAGSVAPFNVCDSVNVIGDTFQESDETFTIVIEPLNALDGITAGDTDTFTVTIEDDGDVGTVTMGGDPHFSVLLPTGQLICYSIQGEHGFFFNLITDEVMQVNALFIPDAVRSEVTWLGALGIVVKGMTNGTTKLQFVANENKINIGARAILDAKGIEKVVLSKGKLTLVENKKKRGNLVEVDVVLEDVGLEFSVRFVKSTHLDMTWKKVQKQPHSHGLIGQFFRPGVRVDEASRLLMLPHMEPVAVMRKPVWHFMERDTPDEQLCWVTMNPGYQGKRLIEGHYLDYLVDDMLSSDFAFKGQSFKKDRV